MATSGTNTLELLVQLYFNKKNFIAFGIEGEKEPFTEVLKNFSSTEPNLLCPVPDKCYKPEVKVYIDFLHQFTQGDGQERLVPPDTLKAFSMTMYRYIASYYGFVLSYGKNGYSKLSDTMNQIDFASVSEDQMSIFVNKILNYYITEVGVTQTRNGIGSCSISMRDTFNLDKKNKRTSIFYNAALPIFNQLLVPFLPIKVWAKGRLYKDYFFPIFDGYIMFASQNNSGGFTTINLVAKDVLELARVSTENVSPALIQYGEATTKKQKFINIFGQALYGHDHFEIVNALFKGGSLDINPDSRKLKVEMGPQEEDTRSPGLSFTALDSFESVDEGDASTINNIVASQAVHKDKLSYEIMAYRTTRKNKRKLLLWGNNITPYRAMNMSSPEIYASQFTSRLQILEEVAGLSYFDFYIDGDGNVNYHPMRLTNQFLTDWYINVDKSNKKVGFQNPFPYSNVFSNHEAISYSTAFNIEQLCTFLHLEGTPPIGGTIEVAQGNLFGSAFDKSKMKRFGYRRQTVSNQMFNYNFTITKDITFLDVAAAALINFMNSELHTRTASIIFRPEMQLCAPMYFVEDNSVFYVNSISHQITVGGDATTTVTGNYGRRDIEKPVDLQSYMLMTEKMRSAKSADQRDAINKEAIQSLLLQIPTDAWINSFDITAAELIRYCTQVSLDTQKEEEWKQAESGEE